MLSSAPGAEIGGGERRFIPTVGISAPLCAEAIEAYCAASHPNEDPSVCFVDQLCSHADTCKTGECASYGEQTQLLQVTPCALFPATLCSEASYLLQNNSTAQKADELELLEETVKTSVGWDCG